MLKRMTVPAVAALATLAGAPALAQDRGLTAIDSPRAPAEPLGLWDGNAEASNWIGNPVRTENGTIKVWFWRFSSTSGGDLRIAFHDEIDCATGQFRQIGHEIYENGRFARGYVVDQGYREPLEPILEVWLIPYVCAERTPEVRVANPDEAKHFFRR